MLGLHGNACIIHTAPVTCIHHKQLKSNGVIKTKNYVIKPYNANDDGGSFDAKNRDRM